MSVDIGLEAVVKTVAQLCDSSVMQDGGPDVCELGDYAANMLEAFSTRLAEVETELSEMTTVKDIHAARRAEYADRAEAAEHLAQERLDHIVATESRVAELEALLAAKDDIIARYHDQSLPDLTAVYMAGAHDARQVTVQEAEDRALERAAALIESTAYVNNGDKRSLEPVRQSLVGMDMHHGTIAAAIRAMKGAKP